MEVRTQKRLVIGGVYLLILAGIGFGLWWRNFAPSCIDGRQNGREEGIDCGIQTCGMACPAPVQALEIQNVWTAQTPLGDYDLAIQIYNPNTEYGVSEGIYNDNHEFYMLPGQTKYLVLTSLTEDVRGVTLQRVEWEKVTADPSVGLTVVREAFTPGPRQSIYEAIVRNDSDFDYDDVDVTVAVFDDNGNLLVTNVSNFQTFLSGTERAVKMIWPFRLPTNARIQLEVGTNVFDNDNFIRRNGTQERFQQYF